MTAELSKFSFLRKTESLRMILDLNLANYQMVPLKFCSRFPAVEDIFTLMFGMCYLNPVIYEIDNYAVSDSQ